MYRYITAHQQEALYAVMRVTRERKPLRAKTVIFRWRYLRTHTHMHTNISYIYLFINIWACISIIFMRSFVAAPKKVACWEKLKLRCKMHLQQKFYTKSHNTNKRHYFTIWSNNNIVDRRVLLSPNNFFRNCKRFLLLTHTYMHT